jgi:hypothetical protein
MKTYKCPLCGSALAKEKYEAVLHIQAEKDKARKADLENAHRLLHQAREATTSLKKQLSQTRERLKQADLVGQKKGALIEKRRQERLTAGLQKKLELANVRISQLSKGTTPQTEGLEFEETLCRRLQKEFPQDRIEHKGKGGDILHGVVFQGRLAGLIIYECKRTPGILPSHIQQAAEAKRIREAHFAILITTGTKKGFTGLGREGNVLIVAPLGVVPLAYLCRAHIIEMAKAKLDGEEKNRVATQMLNFITSPTYKVPLEEAIQQSDKARRLLAKEMRDHAHVWQERYTIYQTIGWDITTIQENVSRVLAGGKALPLGKQEVARLQLPASGGSGASA